MKQILVVDDEPPIREVIGDLLRDEGYEVLYASTGSAMFKVLEKHRPDLVLLDLMMPDVDGREALRAMQVRPQWQSIPVVVVSGMAPYALGGVRVPFLTKPFDLDELLSVVTEVLDGESNGES